MSGFVTPFEENEGVTRVNFNARIAEINGITVTDIGGSNENLLINWDFRDPVNTGGQQSYEGNNQYAIDMWRLSGSASMELQDSGIALTIPFATAGSWANCFTQVLEMDASQLVGRTVTVSILVSSAGANVGCRIRLVGSSDVFIGHILLSSLQNGLNSVSGEIPENTKTIQFQIGNTSTTESGNVTVQAVKLEIGSVSTLQNDPPADKAEQENLCARFGSNGEFITGPLYSNKNLVVNWDFRNPVNTGGLTTYSSRPAQIMTIDKWKIGGTTVPMWTVTVVDGGLNLAVGTAISNTLNYLNTNDLDGKTFTITLLVDNVYYKSSSFVWDSTAGYTQINNFSNGFRISYSGTSNYVQVYNLSGSETALVQAVKLELGSVSTLMNDGLANRAEQESLCARFDYSTGDLITGGPIPTSGVKNIQVSTTDLTPGTSTLATGTLYLVYE